jgi:ABC-type lipoprotein release transport system permease subunit
VIELRLAWRNVWRNPRRTWLTVAATVFAVVLVVFTVGMAAGVHEKMIEDAVRINSGHLSISGPGYLDQRTLEQFVVFDDDLEARIRETEGVTGYAPRVMSFALLARDATTSGVAVLGVDPPRERSVSTLEQRIVEGAFLPADVEHPIVLGQRLANKLGANLGDPLLLYGVAYSLETAYEIFAVTGVVRLPDPELDRNLALITLADAQTFYVYGDRVSEIAVLTEDADHARSVTDALQIELAIAPGAEVHTWEELMPELVQIILLDDAGMYITVAVVIIVVGFGILNTILMAVLERRREFGVLLALGLKPRAVFRIVYIEALALSLVGLVVGLAISLPMLVYLEANPVPLGAEMSGLMELFGAEPVVTWKLKPMNPIGSSITILVLAVVAALYPAIKASRGRPVDVLRSL